MAIINISNVINVSVLAPPAGLAPYSQNNLLCLTEDVPVASLGDVTAYSSAQDVAADWGVESNVYKAAAAVFSQSPNIITGGGLFCVCKMLAGETLSEGMLRAQGLVYYGGVAATMAVSDSDVLDAGAVAESSRKLLFVVKSVETALDSGGLLADIQDQGMQHVRGLYYGLTEDAEKMKWAYAGRAMSTNFAATNTTITMNLKQLITVGADTTATQTIVQKAKAVGADLYVSIAGRSSVLSNGANGFYDDVYNLDWLVGSLQVSGFNFLAQTSTKVPQTEAGMGGLKGAYREVCQQAVANGFVAPGRWTSADTFGPPQDFVRNVADFGYYIYSSPVASQLPADRAQRKAPAVQIAVKYAGAIHTSDVLVYINQ